MKKTIKDKKKMLKRKMFNMAVLLIFSVIVISTYYTANFSKAKDIVEVSVSIKDSLNNEQTEKYVVNALEGSDGDSFYVKLPEYINNKRVIKYSYYFGETASIETVTEESSDTESDIKEETIIDDVVTDEEQQDTTPESTVAENEIGPNDILPESKIYLTSAEVKNKELTIIAHYDTKQVNDKILYNQLLKQNKDTSEITVTGYMPENAELSITEVDLKEAQKTIREQTQKPVILEVAYDIKIQVGEQEYEPYEIDESVNVKITKEDLQDKENNVWHIKDDNQVEKVEEKEITENTITFNTDGFSTYALENVEATALAIDGMADSVLTIDDAESDRYYWLGQNYTDDISGNNNNKYSDSNLANVTVNYYGYANNEVDPDMIGYVSLTERYNVITYKKTCPIINGNVSVELIDNPFIDRPTGYGFGGWTSTDGTITKDSNTNVQTITVTGSTNITLNIYTNWTVATVVYVNPVTGNDNLNDGLTPDKPFGSWEAGYKYLYNNSNDRNDRENNIIVLTGNIDSSINYTRPVTGTKQILADITYSSSTSFTSGGTYILATGTGAGANALSVNGTTITNTTLSATKKPPESAQWIISSSGSGYTIKNLGTGYYLAYSNGLTLQSRSFTWNYNNRMFSCDVRVMFWTTTYYLRYNNGTWTTTTNSSQATSFYFLTYTAENEREGDATITKGNLGSNSYNTSSTNVAVTVTSLYGHTDYRNQATMDLTKNSYQDILAYADLQLEYISIKATGYKTACSGGTSIDSDYPRFYGRANNFRIGRGLNLVDTSTDAAAAGAISGGFDSGTTIGSNSSSGSNNAYKLVVESGKYCTSLGWNQYGVTSHYYGTVYFTLGSDIDRATGNNDDLSVYYRTTINAGGGRNGKYNIRDKSCLINVKSGKFGVDGFEDGNGDIYTSGIYIGGYGTSTGNNTRDLSDRYMIVEGGLIANINCGLKIDSGLTSVLTKLYVKGGEMYNIVGGAGKSTTYGSRIIQITGGKVRYSVSGGSNGFSGEDGEGQITDCDTLVYVGGNAQIGDETLVGYITDSDTSNDNNGKLYLVEAGCVLGAGNGNNPNYTLGQVDNSHIIIADNAHILNSVYGGGNYGVVGARSATSAKAQIDIIGGTVDRSVYGGSNNSNIFGSTTINVKGGQVKGAVYGGSNTTGTISTTSTINVTGGTLGETTNTTDNPVLFGGGYGQNTVVTGNATVNIIPNEQNINIYGSAYGGSSLGKMNSNVTINIKDIPAGQGNATDGDTTKIASITGYVFAGGKGNSSTAATIAEDATINVDGSNLPKCSVFGGNDINGTTSGNITVNVGRTYESILYGAYGGGNQANITTATPNVKVYLLTNANVTNAFNGGKAADLQSSGTSDTTRAIYLQGGHAENIFGGSDSSGTVTASHVYIESGTATNVYGGNNIGGTTNTSYVYVTGGNVENAYGGGYQASTTATNVSLTGGTVTNGFGGGNAADVTNSSITLAGSTTTNIYGGSNQQGTVTSSYVAINSGTVTNVFGGNNAGGNTVDTEVIVNSTTENVYGGGNEAMTTGNTLVSLKNATITGSSFGGGNGSAAVVTGNSVIKVEGTTNIAGDLFGGGNAAANGTTDSPSTVQVYITGGTIGGDVYGAANTSVVNGETQVKIGATAVNDASLSKGNINIVGTLFGGGKSNSAGSEDYDFNFESVTGNVHIDINADGYDNGTYTFTIGGSIFGSGNAAKISGDGYINVSNYGTADSLKENISIQRATEVTLDNCGMYLEGTTDRTNEISTAVYTFNRIKNLIVKNNTTLYLESGANLLEKFTSQDASGNKATVAVGENGVTSSNVDNRIYLQQGKNLILRTEDGSHGEVSGMTYVGLYKGTINRVTGIYSPTYSDGDTIPETEEEFARNSFVQGKHYESHNTEVDGFYTNYDEDGIINVKYIVPTPEVGAYYQWVVGKPSDDIYYDNIELIATKYATTSTYVLELTGLNKPNMTVEVVGFDTSDLKESVELVDQSNIPNVEMDPAKANGRFSLTMTAGNTGWQTKGTTDFYRTPGEADKAPGGTTQYLTENSTTTPSFSIYMASSKNISTTEKLGTVTIQLQASYYDSEKDEIIIRNVYIVLTLSTNNTIKLANDYYEGAITPGKKYGMFPTTNTNITSNSSLSAYYSLYLGNYSTDEDYYYEADSATGMVGYYHCLISTCVLPAGTKITMVDRSASTVQYYYYIVTSDDETNGKKEFKFTEFTNMGSTNEKYDSDLSYYNKDLDVVLEEYIFQVDFADITLANSLEKQKLTIEMRDTWDDTMKLNVNTDQYPMMFNLYSDKEAIKGVDATANKTFIYMGDSFKVDLTTEYIYQQVNAETVYDTTHFEDQLGVKVTVLEGSTPLTASELTGIYIEHGGKKYYARYDGSYRFKIADAVSNVATDMMFYTENGNLETATYTLKFETFGSIDGVYFSSAIATDSVNMQIINTDYGLSAEIDDNSVLIDKTTGKTKNDNNELNFAIGYQAEFTDPEIHISLYRRDYSSIYSSTYNLVDLTEYVTNTLTTTTVANEYLVTDNPQSTQNFVLNLKENIKSGTYKIVFSLYDGGNYIGNVEKMIIIK